MKNYNLRQQCHNLEIEEQGKTKNLSTCEVVH